MKKNILFAASLVALLSSSVVSSVKAAPSGFAGPYAGIIGGYGMNKSESVKQKGGLIGANLGWGLELAQNWFGILNLDVLLGSIKKSMPVTVDGESGSLTYKESFSSALTCQFGYAFGALLPYAELGGQVSSQKVSGQSDVRRQSITKTRLGWVVGAGLKYNLGNVVLSLGYRYSQTTFQGVFQRHKVNGSKILVGAAYKW